MTVFVDYQGSRYELAPGVNVQDGLRLIVDRLNHSWRRQQNATARPDSSAAYIPEDFDPWVHFPLSTGGSISFHVHDSMSVAFIDTDATI